MWNTTTTNRWNSATDVAWSVTTGTTEITTFAGTGGTATFGTNLGVLGVIFKTTGYTPDLCANTFT